MNCLVNIMGNRNQKTHKCQHEIYTVFNVVNNDIQGEYKQYFRKSNQIAMIVNFDKGVPVGDCKMFWDNGNLHTLMEKVAVLMYAKCKFCYKFDISNIIPNGLYAMYYRSGELQMKGMYVNGNRHGMFEYYDKFANLIKTEVYNDGILEPIEGT